MILDSSFLLASGDSCWPWIVTELALSILAPVPATSCPSYSDLWCTAMRRIWTLQPSLLIVSFSVQFVYDLMCHTCYQCFSFTADHLLRCGSLFCLCIFYFFGGGVGFLFFTGGPMLGTVSLICFSLKGVKPIKL